MSVTKGSPHEGSLVTATRYSVLLITEGAPRSTGLWDVWNYLKVQLCNRRVVDIVPICLWKPLLYFLILPGRLQDAQESYVSTWVPKNPPAPSRTNGVVVSSPAATDKSGADDHGVAAVVKSSVSLAVQLERYLNRKTNALPGGDGYIQVEVGFYNRPGSVEAALQRLQLGQGWDEPAPPSSSTGTTRSTAQRLVVLPLYPQYSCWNTASAWDSVMTYAHFFKNESNLPSVHFLRSYGGQRCYIEAWNRWIRRYLADHGVPDWLFVVFLGSVAVPAPRDGDVYSSECRSTFNELTKLLCHPLAASDELNSLSAEDVKGGAVRLFSGALPPTRISFSYLKDRGTAVFSPSTDEVLARIIREARSAEGSLASPATTTTAAVFPSSYGAVDTVVSSKSQQSSRDGRPTAYIVCPGVALDDVATLWTIEKRLCQQCRHWGWKDVQYIPAMNDTDAHVSTLAKVLAPHLQ